MSGNQRVGGPFEVQAGGVRLQCKAGASYNLGHPKREGVGGASRMHGYKESPQVAFIEVAITDSPDLDLKDLVTGKNLTVTGKAANGKTILLHNARYTGEGTVTTDEGEIGCRWESDEPGEEISA